MIIHKTWIRLLLIVSASSLMAPFAFSKEVTLGHAQAPITLIEYGSLTCGNCVSFHRNVMPQIKKHYIDTGTVRFIYRHFPTSKAATEGAHAAQCAGDKYYEMLDALFASVSTWHKAENKNALFLKQATSLGLDSKSYLSCLQDTKQLDDIIKQQDMVKKQLGVIATPTFFINGKVVSGKKTFTEMQTFINEALNKNNQ